MSSHRRRAIVDFDGNEGTGGSRRGRRAQRIVDEENGSEITDNVDMIINTAMRFVLLHENQTKTVSRNEINKFLTEEQHYIVDKATLILIMSELKKRLEELFGYKMVEVSALTYILYNPYTNSEVNMDKREQLKATFEGRDLEAEEIAEVAAPRSNRRSARGRGRHRAEISSEEEAEAEDEHVGAGDRTIDYVKLGYGADEVMQQSKRALLMIVLSLLYMDEDPISEDKLMKELLLLGLPETFVDDSPHEDTTKESKKIALRKIAVDEFRVQNYLKRHKVISQDPDAPSFFNLTWGIRAWLEFSPRDIVAFVKDIYGQPDDIIWLKMKQRVIEDEKKRDALLSEGYSKFEALTGTQTRDLDLMTDRDCTDSAPGENSNRERRKKRRQQPQESDAEEDPIEVDIPEQSMTQLRPRLNGSSASSAGPSNSSHGGAKRTRGGAKESRARDESEVEEPTPRRGRSQKEMPSQAKSTGRKKSQPVTSDDNEEDSDEESPQSTPLLNRSRRPCRKF